uniref:Ketoreductase (KR) domain-containing protein n=1 Tax=Meloidogyne incognita TaxID=6306 RepID=A0A914L9I1_MELIC
MNKQCRVELKLCDVTDVERMKEIFEMPEIQQLNGIIHSAGVLINAPIAAMESSSLAKVVGPKAEGALLINSLLRH